jgi:Family of unknown function (DUF6879)
VSTVGHRITDVASPEFDALFTNFEFTAYRLEALQRYDVSYEIEPYRAFTEGRPRPRDTAKNAWTAMLKDAVRNGKIVQRVHLVSEPLTNYLRYELEWSYPPNVEAGEDIRILPAHLGTGYLAPLRILRDYWLFDSHDLWVMEYGPDGKFLAIEQVTDPGVIVARAFQRDAALHYAIPYADYMRRRELPAAS